MERRLIMTVGMLLTALWITAQTLVSGTVTDRQTGRPLSHVSVATVNGKVHTVTNDDGRFVLKTDSLPYAVRVSHIGYRTQIVPVHTENEKLTIQLTGSSLQLGEVVVSADDPKTILWEAIRRIRKNYPQKPELMRCFYRETMRRGSRFIGVAEAVTEMYKSGYDLGPQYDAVVIQKGRRLLSMKPADTLAVKIQGGPLIPLITDVAKNPDYLLNEEDLAMCSFRMETPQKIDDRLHYVVNVVPDAHALVPLMGGRLFIDKETLTFSRAELQLDVSDWRRASEYMLVRKPLGLRFRPKALTMTLVYHTDTEGVTRLSYVRNEIRFNCDWKRRLFASAYETVSEMVVTDRLRQGSDIRRPRGRSTFGIHERFYDRVEYFEDPDFWADYNIIEPTESLEHAINKLKKHVSPSSTKTSASMSTDTLMVHDPVMAQEGDTYYVLSTGHGLQWATSKDRRSWEVQRTPFIKEIPAWTHDSVPGFRGHVWAPDIIRWHGRWWLAYSCSTFGKNTSAIGLMSANSLNGQWTDEGCLVASREHRDNWNAIDPAFVVDDADRLWMTWGSFWDGIQIAPLTEKVTMSSESCKTIARRVAIRDTLSAEPNPTSRYAGRNAIEAPFILKHGGWYYLFVSWDYCCRGSRSNYRVAVGRSKNVDGPYTDRTGKPMTEGGGTIFFEGDKTAFDAAGHCAVYDMPSGETLFICHGYCKRLDGMSILVQRRITWTPDGWPLIEQ